MKKTLLAFAITFILLSGFAQQPEFPYSKVLFMTKQERVEEKFKYNEDLNQYVLTRRNGGAIIVNMLLVGADIKPYKDDYIITAQYGKDSLAFVDIMFYNDETYHDLVTFAKDNGLNLVETNADKTTRFQFGYDKYAFELSMIVQKVATTTANTYSAAKTVDQSYNVYHFIIHTGIAPESKFLAREAAKQLKRDTKGRKKQSVTDFM